MSYLVVVRVIVRMVDVLARVMFALFRLIPVAHTEETTNAAHSALVIAMKEVTAVYSWPSK